MNSYEQVQGGVNDNDDEDVSGANILSSFGDVTRTDEIQEVVKV